MHKLMSKWSRYIVIVLLLLAVLARFLKMEYLPYADDGDEMAYIFAGQSLMTKGVPASWSSFTDPGTTRSAYELKYYAVAIKPEYILVEPWFDHMYLLPVLMGSWSLLWGYDFPSVLPALIYRIPMLIVSAGVLYLVFKIAEKHFGTLAGIFALILIGFSPSLLIIHRMVVSENFLNLFFLLTYYFYLEKKPLYYLVITSFLAAGVKVTGLAIIPLISFLFIFEKQYKKAAIYFLSSLGLSVISYIVYGALIDWNAFVHTLQKQSYRLLGWSNPAFIFSHPGFHIYTMLDMSYYLILILGLGIFQFDENRTMKQLGFFIISLFTLVWVTSAEQDMLGWYKIPVFSFLAIAAGATIAYKRYYLAITLVAITLVNNLGLIRYPTHPLPDAYTLRGLVSVVIGVTVLYLFYSKKAELHKYVLGLLCCIYIMQSMYIANNVYAARCTDKICPIPIVTFKSVLQSLAK